MTNARNDPASGTPLELTGDQPSMHRSSRDSSEGAANSIICSATKIPQETLPISRNVGLDSCYRKVL